MGDLISQLLLGNDYSNDVAVTHAQVRTDTNVRDGAISSCLVSSFLFFAYEIYKSVDLINSIAIVSRSEILLLDDLVSHRYTY